MIFQGPALTMRTLVEDDESFIRTLFADWEHGFYGGRRDRKFNDSSASKAMGKWLNDMDVQPAERPCGPNTFYREVVIIELGSNPIGLDCYMVRGSARPNNRTEVNEVDTEILALLPQHRSSGIIGGEFATTGSKFAFDILGVDAMIFTMADIVEMRSIIESREFTEDAPVKETPNGDRRSARFMREDWAARLIANPGEATMQFSFTE